MTQAMTVPAAFAAVKQTPADPATQRRLGQAYLDTGNAVAAAALLRTARALGDTDADIWPDLAEAYLRAGRNELARGILDQLPPSPRLAPLAEQLDRCEPTFLGHLDHNRHHRLRRLADHVRRLTGREDPAVLDIGGGDGALCLFLPEADYVLAEPDTNGLKGQDLPFGPETFDVVCACHVLEHVPPANREEFLDSLLEVSCGPVVLLNPFAADGGRHEDRLRLILDITGAPWAREHLECGLPELAEVAAWANRRNVVCDAVPDHAMPAAMLLGLVSHYAHLAGKAVELDRIHGYLNSLPPEALVCPELPAAWRVTLERNRE